VRRKRPAGICFHHLATHTKRVPENRFIGMRRQYRLRQAEQSANFGSSALQ
jgi:hypothetical protein